MTRHPALTVFRGRAGDHNDRAMRGAVLVADELSRRFEVAATHVGRPEPALNLGWEPELAAALPALREMATEYERLVGGGSIPVTALSRCTVALATLPVVARHRPDACVVWLDAHADLNTPSNSTTGYLGGLPLSGAAGLWDSGLGGELSTDNIVLGGVRDLDPPEQQLVDDGVVLAVPPGPSVSDRMREAVAGRPVYVHLDCDVLEPGIVPTDYGVPGGFDLAALHAVSGVLAEHEVVGVELAEFEDSWAETGNPASPSALLDALRPLLDAVRRAADTPV